MCVFEVAQALRDWLGENNFAGQADDSMRAAELTRFEEDPKEDGKENSIPTHACIDLPDDGEHARRYAAMMRRDADSKRGAGKAVEYEPTAGPESAEPRLPLTADPSLFSFVQGHERESSRTLGSRETQSARVLAASLLLRGESALL